MGKSASDVRNDIDTTRREMAYTIDEIADRASPRRVVERRRQRVADRWYSMRVAVMGEPDAHGDGGASGGVREAMGSAQGAAGDAVGRAGEQAAHLAEQAREAPEMMRRRTQGNPVAAGLVAFGAGLLAASMLPSTEREQRAARTLRESAGPLEGELKQAGRQVAEDVKDSATERAEHLKETSSEAARDVQEHARGSAQSVQEQAQEQAQQVRGGGQGTA